MLRLSQKLLEHLPFQFRTLYRQFLLRVVDLEALSIQADIPRFLGQFAGVLILFSIIQAMGIMIAANDPSMTRERFLSVTWNTEQSLISTTMLVVGLVAVVCWDNIFPDRRDTMILSPLPVSPHTVFFAKAAASGAVLGISVLSLNFATGVALPIVLGGFLRFPQVFAAYWFTMIAATAFLFGSVLAVQGITALLLPRRVFLRLSAFLQLAAFELFFAVYFFEPYIHTRTAINATANHRLLEWSPQFWFFALFNQLSSRLPCNLTWLALRAWVGLLIVLCVAALSLLLCYLKLMKKTVEEPDIVPGGRRWRWRFWLGSPLQTAVVLFSVRSLARSRQHRVIYAFFLGVAFAIAASTLHGSWAGEALHPLTPDFLTASLVMMCLAVLGLRSIFSLPISLNANWVLRLTQLCPSKNYIAATRRALLWMSVLPMWCFLVLLSLCFRPLFQAAAHLIVLALVGSILVDASLIGVSKIPFACSYLPGKSNIQYMFWGFVIIFIPLAAMFAVYEQRSLYHPWQYAGLIGLLGGIAGGLWAFNRHRAQSATLYYDEIPQEVITTLKLNPM